MSWSKKSRRCWIRPEAAVLAACLLLLAGCAPTVVPLLVPLNTPRTKAGGPNEALLALPNEGLASVYLDYACNSDGIWIVRVGIVNHRPDRVTVLYGKTRVYVDDGRALTALDHREFNSEKRRVDSHLMKTLPEGAEGEWIIFDRRNVAKGSIRGPTVVVSYVVHDVEGFVKIPYRAIWDIPG